MSKPPIILTERLSHPALPTLLARVVMFWMPLGVLTAIVTDASPVGEEIADSEVVVGKAHPVAQQRPRGFPSWCSMPVWESSTHELLAVGKGFIPVFPDAVGFKGDGLHRLFGEIALHSVADGASAFLIKSVWSDILDRAS